jgi:hypothetical protein
VSEPKDVAELREACVARLHGHTDFSRDTNLTGEYLTGLIWPLIERALASQSLERDAEIGRWAKLAAARLTAIETYKTEIVCLQTMHVEIRRAAIEECAMVPEHFAKSAPNAGQCMQGFAIAKAIRALAQQPPDKEGT